MHKKTSLTEAIIKRLSEISSDEEAFNEAAPPYQEALPKKRLFAHPKNSPHQNSIYQNQPPERESGRGTKYGSTHQLVET